jgi:hypothetical protein
VRHDKDGAGYDGDDAGCSGVSGHGCGYHWRRRQPRGGTLAGLAAGWSLADAVLLVAAWVVSHRGGDCAPPRGYSSHTKTYRSLRQ